MTAEEELRMAWALWNMLSQLTEILWEKYESDFVDLCIELDRRSPFEFGHPTKQKDSGGE